MSQQDEFKQYCNYWGIRYDFAHEAMEAASDEKYFITKKSEKTQRIDFNHAEIEKKCLTFLKQGGKIQVYNSLGKLQHEKTGQ